jgi:hypothetical protein
MFAIAFQMDATGFIIPQKELQLALQARLA